jgi:hypothetical protein
VIGTLAFWFGVLGLLAAWVGRPGPLFGWTLRRFARHGTLHQARCALLLLALGLIGLVSWPTTTSGVAHTFQTDARNHGMILLIVQGVAWVFVAPFWLVGWWQDLQQRRALDELYISPLSNVEIVLGPILARWLALVSCLLLTVPAFVVLEARGGLAIWEWGAGLLTLAFALLFLAGLSAGCVQVATSSVTAVLAAWFILLVVWIVLPPALVWGVGTLAPLATSPGWVLLLIDQRYKNGDLGIVVLVEEVGTCLVWQMVYAFSAFGLATRTRPFAHTPSIAGAAVADLEHLVTAERLSADLSTALATPEERAAFAQSWLLCLRRWIVRHLTDSPIGTYPVLWREWYKLDRVLLFVIFGISCVWLLFSFLHNLLWFRDWSAAVDYTCAWGCLFVSLWLIWSAGLRACNAIVYDVERGVLADLLLTDLTPAEIVGQKWWGVLGRHAYWVVVLLVLVGAQATTSISRAGLLLLMAGAAIGVVAASASWGLLFSLLCATATQARLWWAGTLLIGHFGAWGLGGLQWSPLGLLSEFFVTIAHGLSWRLPMAPTLEVPNLSAGALWYAIGAVLAVPGLVQIYRWRRAAWLNLRSP